MTLTTIDQGIKDLLIQRAQEASTEHQEIGRVYGMQISEVDSLKCLESVVGEMIRDLEKIEEVEL